MGSDIRPSLFRYRAPHVGVRALAVLAVLGLVPGCYQVTGIGDGLGNGEDNPGPGDTVGQTTGPTAGDDDSGIQLDTDTGIGHPGDTGSGPSGTGDDDDDDGGAGTGDVTDSAGGTDTLGTDTTPGTDTLGDDDPARCGNPPDTSWPANCLFLFDIRCQTLPDYGYQSFADIPYIRDMPPFNLDTGLCAHSSPMNFLCEFDKGSTVDDWISLGGLTSCQPGHATREIPSLLCTLIPDELRWEIGAPIFCKNANLDADNKSIEHFIRLLSGVGDDADQCE